MTRIPLPQPALIIFLLIFPACAFSQTPKPPVEVPFEFVHNQIVVPVKIGGTGPYNMLIDTDTDPSAIDAATARDLGLVTGSKGGTATGGGTEVNTIYPTHLPTVELGSLVARDVAAVTIDLTKISERAGRPIQGVLGFSFLKDRIVQIDYPNSKLRFFTESPYPRIQMGANTVNQVSFPLRREDGEVMVDSVFVNDQKMRATLDTGSSSTFNLTRRLAQSRRSVATRRQHLRRLQRRRREQAGNPEVSSPWPHHRRVSSGEFLAAQDRSR